jgi:hypothetical protein
VNTAIPSCEPCKKIGAFSKGNDLLTLQALYAHCSMHPSELVVYIHDNGYYSSPQANDNLRRVLTKAAFSSQCVNLPRDSGCHTCSAEVSVVPELHTPGNMFVAECSYVNKLLSPPDYVQSKDSLMLEVRSSVIVDAGNQKNKYQLDRPEWVGTGRFAMHHWVHSHPSVRSCYVRETEFEYSSDNSDEDWTPHRRLGPRDTDFPKSFSVHPWFKLRGRLAEWNYHYRSKPPQESWVWSYYANHLAESRHERRFEIPILEKK